ncbi:MAG: hypothetical protein WCO65_01995 [bacterium]
MTVENDVFKKISMLEENKDVAGLEDIKQTAEAGFEGDVAGAAEQAISRLTTKVEELTTTSLVQENQIHNLAGNMDEVNKSTEIINNQIKDIALDAQRQVDEINNNENNSNVEIIEKNKRIEELDLEIGGLLEQITAVLPEKMKQLVNSESYKKLIDLNEKRKKEEKSLAELYFKLTEGDGSHRRIHFSPGEYGDTEQYVNDLKFFNTSKDIITRFEEYKDKFKTPENNASNEFNSEYRKLITEDLWKFEEELGSKSDKVFGIDGQNKEDSKKFKQKYLDRYQTNYSLAQENSIPGKVLYVNTMGTIIYPQK